MDGAHEKGGVEGEIGRFRRRHLTPIPHVPSLAALNAALAAADARDNARRIGGRTETVGEAAARELVLLRPLPAEPFDVALVLSCRVDAKALRGSLTWDQGPEMRDWRHVSVAADIDIYFCDARPRPGSAAPTRTPTGCCGNTSPRAVTSRCTPRPSWTGSPPSSTTGLANGCSSEKPIEEISDLLLTA